MSKCNEVKWFHYLHLHIIYEVRDFRDKKQPPLDQQATPWPLGYTVLIRLPRKWKWPECGAPVGQYTCSSRTQPVSGWIQTEAFAQETRMISSPWQTPSIRKAWSCGKFLGDEKKMQAILLTLEAFVADVELMSQEEQDFSSFQISCWTKEAHISPGSQILPWAMVDSLSGFALSREIQKPASVFLFLPWE